MTVPAEIQREVETVLADVVAKPVSITGTTRLGGGCISPAARLEISSGEHFFLKWGERMGKGIGAHEPERKRESLFRAEARSLEALKVAGAVRVPGVVAVGDSWLLLEWLEPGAPTPAAWAALGRGLAALHRVRGTAWGWPADNFIGALPQTNGWLPDWPTFWREQRLLPQLRHAVAGGHFGSREQQRFERLWERLDTLLQPAVGDGPSLLHGDLWGGNVHMMAHGEPAVIDPASYYGHREVDLAMAELFGGFPPGFFEAYRESWPLAPGYREGRRGVYQLYYLLVHVNLFGAGYRAGTIAALTSAGV